MVSKLKRQSRKRQIKAGQSRKRENRKKRERGQKDIKKRIKIKKKGSMRNITVQYAA